jgi:hypothetical protein
MSQLSSIAVDAVSPLSDLTAMSVNEVNEPTDSFRSGAHESISVEEGSEDDGDVHPFLMVRIWDDDKITRLFGVGGKLSWQCGYCNQAFSGHNATKALAHVVRVSGQDIAGCKKYHFIPVKKHQSHMDLNDRRQRRKEDRTVVHAAVNRSIVQHQGNLTEAVMAARGKKRSSFGAMSATPVAKKRPPGKTPSLTESTLTSSVISKTSSHLGPRRLLTQRITNESLNAYKGDAELPAKPLMQLSIHDGPNPSGEAALTSAVADMIHSVGLPFSLSEDPKFRRVIKLARNVGSNFITPSRQRIGDELLKLNYNIYVKQTKKVLLNQAETHGLTLYGDGATVKKMPLINILCAGVHNPAAVLEIVNCSQHLQGGGKKDATYIAGLFKPHLKELDPQKALVDLVYFDGASNVQKAGNIIGAHYPRVTCLHGSEHVVSLFFGDLSKLSAIKAFIRFYRRVYKWFGSGSHHVPYAIFSNHVCTWMSVIGMPPVISVLISSCFGLECNAQ